MVWNVQRMSAAINERDNWVYLVAIEVGWLH
jgi:hypothetical protein